MSIKKRSNERRKRIVGHRARNFADAEQWDLEFWQSCTPEERLSALVALRKDLAKIHQGKSSKLLYSDEED